MQIVVLYLLILKFLSSIFNRANFKIFLLKRMPEKYYRTQAGVGAALQEPFEYKIVSEEH